MTASSFRPPRNGLGYRPHRTTLAGSLGEAPHSAERAVGTPRMPAGGKCPHCGERGLYREEGDDAIACLCGWRTY